MNIRSWRGRRLAATLAATALLGTLAPAATFAQAPDASTLDRVSSSPIPDPADRVLAAGDPALTQGTADKVAGFLGWLLDAPLTDAQRGTIRDGLVSTWKKGDRAGIQNTLGMAATYDKLATCGEAQRAFVRAQSQPQFLASLRAGTDETSRWLLGIYRAAHPALAPGDPPLTRDVSDSLAEVLCFMVNQTAGEQRLTADARFKDACARSLAASYPQASAAQRQYVARMPLFWAALQVAWPQLTEDQRAGYRRQFAVALRTLLPPSQAAPADRPQMAAAPPAGPLTEAERRRRSQIAYETIMRRMQMQHSLFMGMSGAMMAQHWNTMNAISNIGGSGGTYVNPQTGVAY